MQVRNIAKSALFTVHQDSATLIRLTKLTETSLIVTWLTEHHGIVKTVGKGARRQKSSFRGKLDLFYTTEMCWTEAKSGDLHYLKEVTPLQYRENISKSYKNTECAAYFVVLLESLIEPGGHAEGLHDLLNRALNFLNEKAATKKAIIYFEKEVATLLGVFSPEKQPHLLLKSILGQLPANRSRCMNLFDST